MTQAATETAAPPAGATGATEPAAGATGATAAVEPPTAGATGATAAAPAAGATGATAPADDALTPEEEAALGDPGKRALERIREQREAAKTEATTTATENAQLREQLTTAMAQLQAGGDEAQQQALQTVTTERDTAVQTLDRITAAMRNGLAVPHQGEAPEAFAARVQQVAGLLQGADAAALDASAKVLLSLTGTPGAVAPPRVTTGDPAAALPGSGAAGQPNMDDALRKMAGR